MDIHQLMMGVLDTRSGTVCYSFCNADGKRWLMPVRNMRVAMNLYQPSGRNGKLVKCLFPLLHNVSIVRRIVHAEQFRCRLNMELNQLLERIFQTTDLEFAIFFGTPCVHQKATIQISKGRQILGYCKIVESEDIAMLFGREEKMLHFLEKSHVRGVPRCLYCGQLDNDLFLFVQNTIKTQSSKVVHGWENIHERFIGQMYEKTHREIVFEESDLCRALSNLKEHLDWLPNKVDRPFVARVISDVVNRYSGKTVTYSAYHADFTPWNMFVEKGKLFVFDWEYAKATYPPKLDRYHFFTQTAIFEKYWQEKEIIAYLESTEANWVDREAYTLYLLDVISRFTMREKGFVTGDVAQSMKIWTNLLKYLAK